MPLDTGRITELQEDAVDRAGPDLTDAAAPSLNTGASIGDALRAVREHQGLTVEDVAETTRVRRAYLSAIEDMRLETLPSRPFTIGYVRAYAQALGLDGDAAVARFKADEPVLDEPLREPVGVRDERDPRMVAFVVAAIIIVIAIVVWNVAQRAMTAGAPPASTAPAAAAGKALAEAPDGQVSLGAPLPAPVESTTPQLYETPGLADAGVDGMGNLAPPANLAETPTADIVDVATLAPTFTPKGAVYGGGARTPSLVTVQALKPAALIIRGADGSVYFARQLAPGEAYRAPQVAGLTIDVSEPQDFQVFVGGRSKGVLPASLVLVSRLAG